MGDDGMIKLGPMGRRDGKAWDETGRAKIVQIFISYGDREINSIQFQYAENGRLKLSEKHGHSSGTKFDAVKLKQATEHITWLRGHRRINTFKDGSLCSITFGTNRGQYGPFGTFEASDTEFCLNTADCMSVNSIGLYLNPNVALEDHKPIIPRNK